MNDYSNINAAYFLRMGIREGGWCYNPPGRPAYMEILGRRFALETWREFPWSNVLTVYQSGWRKTIIFVHSDGSKTHISASTAYWIARVVREAKVEKAEMQKCQKAGIVYNPGFREPKEAKKGDAHTCQHKQT